MLDATPASPTANAYCTLDEANVYNLETLDYQTWLDDVANQEAAIREACRVLSRYPSWNGQRATTTQRLPWPRRGVFYADTMTLIPETIIPEWLKEANAELARLLLPTMGAGGGWEDISFLRFADVSLALQPQQKPVMPSSVQAIIGPYLVGGGGIVKRLVRM